MGKNQPQHDPQGAVPNNPARPALQLDANPADIRAAWRAAFQEEAKLRPSLWPLLWVLLGGLVATLVLGAVVLFVPPVRNTVAGILAPQGMPEPTQARPLPIGALTLAFEGSSPLSTEPDDILGSRVAVTVRDSAGQPVPDAVVQFRVEPGEGNPAVQLGVAEARTGVDGRATVTLVPGSVPGSATLVARLDGKDHRLPIVVRAVQPTPAPTTPAPPAPRVAGLIFEPPSMEMRQISGPISITVAAQAKDGKGIPAQPIKLGINGSGSISPMEVVTGPDGRAQFRYVPAEPKLATVITAASGEMNGRLDLLLPATPAGKIALEPTAFDFGVNQKARVKMIVTTLDGGAPITNTPVTLSVQPERLATIGGQATYRGTTDASNGELTAELVFGPVTGAGKLVVVLVDGTQAVAPITVRPVVVAPTKAVNLRTGPGASFDQAGELPAGQSAVVLGKNADGSWLQVRMAGEPLAWVSGGVVKVTGGLDSVPVVMPTPAPTAPPTVTQTPTNTPSPIPRTVPVVSTPTPKAAQGGGYPAAGKYTVTVLSGGSGALLYRGDDPTIQLAELPAGGTVQVQALPVGQKAPPSTVWVQVQFWVLKERVPGIALSHYDSTSQACWDVEDENGQISPKLTTCGSLFPVKTNYDAGNAQLSRGDWRQVTVQALMPQANLGSPQ